MYSSLVVILANVVAIIALFSQPVVYQTVQLLTITFINPREIIHVSYNLTLTQWNNREIFIESIYSVQVFMEHKSGLEMFLP